MRGQISPPPPICPPLAGAPTSSLLRNSWSATVGRAGTTKQKRGLFLDALTMFKIQLVTFSRFQDYRVLESSTECYRVLQSKTEYYRVLQSITEYYRVLQSVTVY